MLLILIVQVSPLRLRDCEGILGVERRTTNQSLTYCITIYLLWCNGLDFHGNKYIFMFSFISKQFTKKMY